MAKHFSVEWLSQSYHSQVSDNDGRVHSKTDDHMLRDKGRGSEYSMGISIVSNMSDHLHTDSEEMGKDVHLVPNSPSNSCGYTSSSDSEVGDQGEGESSSRRARTKFTSDQIFRLEKTFNKHKYLGATQRRKIAEKLNLSETQVKTWFQNRRMKLKRDVQDLRAEYLTPSLLPSLVYPSAAAFQHHRVGGQLLAFPSTAAPQTCPRSMQTIPAQHFQPRPQPAVHPMILASCYY